MTSTLNGTCLAVADSLIVTINDAPVVTILSDDSICANVISFDMLGEVTTGYTTNWSADGFGGIADASAINTVYTLSPLDTVSGFIDIYLTTVIGLCPVEYDSMRIHFLQPPIAYAGPDLQFCDNEPAALAGALGGSAFSGTWSSMGTGSFDPSP